MTSDQIATWAESQDSTAGKHSLSRQQTLNLLSLRSKYPDATQDTLAALVGCSQASVSRYLADYRDTVDEANLFIKAQALPAALTVAESMTCDNPKVRLDAGKALLQANKLLGNEEKTQVIGIQVVLGYRTQHQQVSGSTERTLSDTGENTE